MSFSLLKFKVNLKKTKIKNYNNTGDERQHAIVVVGGSYRRLHVVHRADVQNEHPRSGPNRPS